MNDRHMAGVRGIVVEVVYILCVLDHMDRRVLYWDIIIILWGNEISPSSVEDLPYIPC